MVPSWQLAPRIDRIIDGGGIRGYTMILVLEELMHQCFVSIHGRGKAPLLMDISRISIDNVQLLTLERENALPNHAK